MTFEIPEKMWPSAAAPWRVVWGLGAHKDFPTEAEAQECYEGLKTLDDTYPHPPFNAWDRFMDQVEGFKERMGEVL